MRLIMRWMGILMITFTGLLLATLSMSPHIPKRIGTIVISGMDGRAAQQEQAYFDLDTGIISAERLVSNVFDVPTQVIDFMVFTLNEDSPVLYYVSIHDWVALFRYDSEGTSLINHYPAMDVIGLYWHIVNERLLLIESHITDGVILHSLDIETGDMSDLQSFPDLLRVDVSYSPPDVRYLVFIGIGSGQSRLNKPHYLLDTHTGMMRELGASAFAHWSPTGDTLALGYESAVSDELDVYVYDVSDNTEQALGVRIAEDNQPSIYGDFGQSGVLWSSDGQQLALLNTNEGILYSVNIASGEVLTVEGSNLIPKAWSPNNRYLLTIGEDAEGNTGAFIVDFHSHDVIPIQSELAIQNWNTLLLWSPDSQHIAHIQNAHAQARDFELIVYDVTGEVVRKRYHTLAPAYQLYFDTAHWLAGE